MEQKIEQKLYINRRLTKESMQMTNKYSKKYSISLVIRKMQMKATKTSLDTCNCS